MDKRVVHPESKNHLNRLREMAERKAQAQLEKLHCSEQGDRDTLLQELQIHQIELELQNEELRESQYQLELTHQQYLELYNSAPVGYASVDSNGIILRCNQTLAELLGREIAALLGRGLAEFMTPKDQAVFRSRFHAFCRKPENKHIDVQFCSDKDIHAGPSFIGRIQGRLSSKLPALSTQSKLPWSESMLLVISDVTELKKTEERIVYQAYHDSLTGLPNRATLLERLAASVAQSRRHRSFGALLFMDIDRFKNINDSLGHQAGDELLIKFAVKLHTCIRTEDLLVRMGGDEFVILLADQEHDSNTMALHAQRMAQHLTHALTEPLDVAGNTMLVTLSIGITVFPFQPTDEVDDVIRQADTAMYQAKTDGRNLTRFFHSQLEQRARQRLSLEAELRIAIHAKQLEVYYQPQVCPIDGRIKGMEALLRWRHPSRGLVAPGEFIQVLEETGLIVSVGLWVLQQVAAQLHQWQAIKLCKDGMCVSVNISASQFQNHHFSDRVLSILNQYSIDPSCLVFEITETLLLPADTHSKTEMNRLENLGITFSVDDFGTGYSSLFVLQKSKVGQLKIAQQFVGDLNLHADADAEKHRNVLALIRAIVSMAKELNMSVVAEGVERKDQLTLLTELGCDLIQGFLYSRPLPASEMTQLLEKAAIAI